MLNVGRCLLDRGESIYDEGSDLLSKMIDAICDTYLMSHECFSNALEGVGRSEAWSGELTKPLGR